MHDKQAEVQLLHLDVDHYKGKLQQANKCRECSCRSRVLESKEVQVGCDTDLVSEPNGANGQNGHTEKKLSNLHTYCIHILPKKYRIAKEQIEKLTEVEATKVRENRLNFTEFQSHWFVGPLSHLQDKQIATLQSELVEITKKTSVYRELAVSRRAEIKKLEAKVAIPNTNSAAAPVRSTTEIPSTSEPNRT